jgi:hypothetical protein
MVQARYTRYKIFSLPMFPKAPQVPNGRRVIEKLKKLAGKTYEFWPSKFPRISAQIVTRN